MKHIQLNTHIEISENESELAVFVNMITKSRRRIFVVTGGARTQNGLIFKKIIIALKDIGAEFDLFEGVSSNPLDTEIAEGANQIRSGGHDLVLTVGGGSVHDAGKLMAVLGRQLFRAEEIIVENAGYERIEADVVPTYCIPVLIGTGAEISPASLLRIHGQKKIVFSPHMYPKAVHYSLPLLFTGDRNLDLMTAFDALVQSMEAYLSPSANDWSDMFARQGMRLSLEGMAEFSRDPSSVVARRKLVLAAIQGLTAVSNSSVGAIHALSDPLSGIYGVHHGTALALVAKETLKLIYPARIERLNEIAALFNDFSRKDESGVDIPYIIDEFLFSLCPTWRKPLETLNIKLQEIGRLVADSRNPDMAGSPVVLDDKQIREVFCRSFNL